MIPPKMTKPQIHLKQTPIENLDSTTSEQPTYFPNYSNTDDDLATL